MRKWLRALQARIVAWWEVQRYLLRVVLCEHDWRYVSYRSDARNGHYSVTVECKLCGKRRTYYL